MIIIKNLNFNYYKGTKKVIDNLSVKIEKGTINILLGLNGCGKTTLIKLLSGLLEPTSGEIFYDNRLLKDISIKERSKIFSYVSQKSINSDDFNVKDYLTYGVVNTLKFYEQPKDEHEKDVLY